MSTSTYGRRPPGSCFFSSTDGQASTVPFNAKYLANSCSWLFLLLTSACAHLWVTDCSKSVCAVTQTAGTYLELAQHTSLIKLAGLELLFEVFEVVHVV
jgi:hypothetical protein